MTFTNIAHSVVLAFGWRRAAIALAAGAVSVLGFAPINFWPVLFFTFPVVVWLIDGASAGRAGGIPSAAWSGWLFGFGFFLAGLYWIGNAFLVDAKIFGWLLPIAVSGLPAGLAIFTAFGFALARLLWRPGAIRILALALALTIAEWLRGHLLTGFPWNVFGYALTTPLALAQSVSLIGIWGLTLLAVAVFASPALLADDKTATLRRFLPLASGLAVLAGLAAYGAIRLAQNPTRFVDNVHLRIMQPNLQQDEKFNYGAKQQVLSRYLALSGRATSPQNPGIQGVTHLIWPESAFPFFLNREAEALARIADFLPEGSVLITGGVRAAEQQPNPGRVRAYNSIYVVDHDGSIVSSYDKVHLVPFGEYLPFQSLLEKAGLMQLTKLPGGFLSGDTRRAQNVPGAPRFLPLICYEAIFPEDVAANGTRAGWLLNVTNDGWFGKSSGPLQHFQQARMRAIEQGLPLVRAANTGISAVVDPLGRVINSLPLGEEGLIDAALPQPVSPPFYARWGDGPIGLLIGIIALMILRRRLSRRY